MEDGINTTSESTLLPGNSTAQTQDGAIQKELRQAQDQFRILKDETAKELREQQARIVEVLGVFAALFTFISIEVQLFRELIVWQSFIGITLITAGVLIGFVLTLSIAFRPDRYKSWGRYMKFSSVAIAGIVIGIGLAAWGGSVTIISAKIDFSNQFVNKEEFNIRALELSKDTNALHQELQDFKNCILRKGAYECSML